jgi:putative toxin-antitoxin system antitoxin component (TIGR02293 family)
MVSSNDERRIMKAGKIKGGGRAKVSSTLKGLPSAWRVREQPVNLYRSSVIDRMLLVKQGVPSRYLRVLATLMKVPVDRLYRTLGLVRPTVDRKMRLSRPLSADESERVLGLARLIGQAQNMVEESGGHGDFDAAMWVAKWLDGPLPALGGRTPAEFMGTADGRHCVADLLAQQQSGTYA